MSDVVVGVVNSVEDRLVADTLLVPTGSGPLQRVCDKLSVEVLHGMRKVTLRSTLLGEISDLHLQHSTLPAKSRASPSRELRTGLSEKGAFKYISIIL